ncbi:MAG: hypothetical protein WCL18_01125 [bacterium]
MKANGISTLRNKVVHNTHDMEGVEYIFPLIVKPLSQGSSIAITNESVVYTLSDLTKQVDVLLGL